MANDEVPDLRALLTPRLLGGDRFQMGSHDIGSGRVFGGQVLGQALASAYQTVDPQRFQAHSLHAYFLRAGDHTRPIDYQVDRQRDGRSYLNRRVVASQQGRPIFNLAASFQRHEDGLDHQLQAPTVPDPESLPELATVTASVRASRPGLRIPRWQEKPLGVEFRPIDPAGIFAEQPCPPRVQIWFRVPAPLPVEPGMAQCVLAYLSDFWLLKASLGPHLAPGRRFSVASLDHAMWFQRPFDPNDWLLYDCESPTATGGRGLSRGRIFRRDGALVAQVIQEGVTRVDTKPSKG